MTIPAHAELGIAFFQGKTLQYKYGPLGAFQDYTGSSCPDFIKGGSEWRIKPAPKVTRYLAYEDTNHELRFRNAEATTEYERWKRIPALDKEVTEES